MEHIVGQETRNIGYEPVQKNCALHLETIFPDAQEAMGRTRSLKLLCKKYISTRPNTARPAIDLKIRFLLALRLRSTHSSSPSPV